MLKTRYKNITAENTEVITFGYSESDFNIAAKELIELDTGIHLKILSKGFIQVSLITICFLLLTLFLRHLNKF